MTASTVSATFAVSDVTRAVKPCPEVSYAEALLKTVGGELEAYSRDTKPLVDPIPSPDAGPVHAFIYAANLAYDGHRPLVLSPDMIWLLIAQGFAIHVNENAAALRGRLVAHEGKAKITVRRDEFVRGFAGNDWEGVLDEFAERIGAYMGSKAFGLTVREFSTTGRVERAAFAVALMDTVQSYYDFGLLTLCGIPEITLEGTPEDWAEVRLGAEALTEWDLDWWTKHLLPVLDQFVAASRGDVDLTFWQSFYKVEHQSGGPYINGHVVNLFPYSVAALPSPRERESLIRSYRERRAMTYEQAVAHCDEFYQGHGKPFRNRHLGWRKPDKEGPSFEGMISGVLPPALSSAPLTWECQGTTLPMEFVAGFVGVSQDTETMALRPEIGWAVRAAGQDARCL